MNHRQSVKSLWRDQLNGFGWQQENTTQVTTRGTAKVCHILLQYRNNHPQKRRVDITEYTRSLHVEWVFAISQ